MASGSLTREIRAALEEARFAARADGARAPSTGDQHMDKAAAKLAAAVKAEAERQAKKAVSAYHDRRTQRY